MAATARLSAGPVTEPSETEPPLPVLSSLISREASRSSRKIVRARRAGKATVRVLRRGGRGEVLLPAREVTLEPGLNRIAPPIRDRLSEEDGYIYEVIVESSDDANPSNNRGEALVDVGGETRVLYAEGARGEERYLRAALEKVFSIDLRSLAAFRVALGGVLLVDLALRARDLTAHYTELGVLPRAAFAEHPVGWLVPWFSLHAHGPPAVQVALFVLAALLAAALAAGYHARLAACASWLLLVSLQNRNRFNQFSARYNTIEFTYLKTWHVQLFAYPTRDETWWFKLYLYKGKDAQPEHLIECFQICLDTKDKLTRENPAF